MAQIDRHVAGAHPVVEGRRRGATHDTHAGGAVTRQGGGEIVVRRDFADDGELGVGLALAQAGEGRQRDLETLVRRHEPERGDQERLRVEAEGDLPRALLRGRWREEQSPFRPPSESCPTWASGRLASTRWRANSLCTMTARLRSTRRSKSGIVPGVDRIVRIEQAPRRHLAAAAGGVAHLLAIARRVAPGQRQSPHQVVQHELVQHHDSRQLERQAEALGMMRRAVADLVDDQVETLGRRRQLRHRATAPTLGDGILRCLVTVPGRARARGARRGTGRSVAL